MAIPSILLILVSSLLLSHPQARRTLEEPPAICSSSCGEIRNISYPFRLTTDPPGCGDPEFELSCDPTNHTILQYLSHSYLVNHISYHNSTIRIVDPNLADGTCTFPSYYDLVNAADTRFTVPIETFLLSFLNCSSNVSDPKYIRVPCLGSNAHSFVYVAYDGFTFSALDPSCSLISMVPVLPQGPRNNSYEATVELLRSGFDLSWSVFCRDCVHSGGSCVVASFDDPYVYVCADDDYLVSVLISYVASLLGSFLFVAILVVRQVLVPLVLVAFLIHKYVTTRKKVDNVEQFVRNEESAMPKRYSYVDIVAITNHFRDKLGQGGFGSVYKGQLPGGCFVAVKMLNSSCKLRGDEFINEVSTIGRVRHRTVVGLMGFCSQGSHRALVYKYMPNGSLDKHIFSEKGKAQLLSWEKLLEIALGAARGINYLHKGCDVCILHFDIKPHNVLLDRDFVPKIADFGLAKFYPKERDIVSVSTTKGTIGYIAPELISKNFGSVSTKADVYSFGMVLMEMAGGRRNVDVWEENSSRVSFPLWAHERLSGGEGLGLENVSESESKIAQKMCVVGLWCIQTKATDRPSMSRVVEMLEGNFEDLEMPPKPEFSTPEYVSMRDSERESSSECLISESVEKSLYIDNSNV